MSNMRYKICMWPSVTVGFASSNAVLAWNGLRRSSEDASEGMENKIKLLCTGKGQAHMIVHGGG